MTNYKFENESERPNILSLLTVQVGPYGFQYHRKIKEWSTVFATVGGLSKIAMIVLGALYIFFAESSNLLHLAIEYQKVREKISSSIWGNEKIPKFDLFEKHLDFMFHVRLFCYSRCHRSIYNRCYSRKDSKFNLHDELGKKQSVTKI